MDNVSRDILLSTRQMRRIFEQIGALLFTADGLMGKQGWDTTGNTAVAYSSASIHLPEQWMPREVFRFYKKDDSPDTLLFICVLLETRSEYEFELKQSLITAGCFRYGRGEAADKLEYRWARFHGFMPERTDEGAVHCVNSATQWPGEAYPFEQVCTFGLPLASISDSRDLDNNVIKKLLGVA